MNTATVGQIVCPRCGDRMFRFVKTNDFIQGSCGRPGCLVLHYRVKAVSITIAQLRALQLLREGYKFAESHFPGGSTFRLYEKPRSIFGVTIWRQTLAALLRKKLLLCDNNGILILNGPACNSADVWNQKPLR